MNEELLLDSSAFTLFYSLKHDVFSSNCKNFFPNYINLMGIPIKQITNETENLPCSCRRLILKKKKKLRPLILNVVSRFCHCLMNLWKFILIFFLTKSKMILICLWISYLLKVFKPLYILCTHFFCSSGKRQNKLQRKLVDGSIYPTYGISKGRNFIDCWWLPSASPVFLPSNLRNIRKHPQCYSAVLTLR